MLQKNRKYLFLRVVETKKNKDKLSCTYNYKLYPFHYKKYVINIK